LAKFESLKLFLNKISSTHISDGDPQARCLELSNVSNEVRKRLTT